MKYFGFIYKWTDSTNGKTYTGSHKGLIDDGYTGSDTLFMRAYNKRPTEFYREILEYVYDEKLLEIEQKYLNQINWENTYNLSFSAGGGFMRGRSQSKDHKQKISEANKGKIFSEDHKRKISEANRGQEKPWLKGRILSEEHKKKIRESKIGKIHSEETKKKMSELKKGEKHPFYGRKHSKESKRKMREASAKRFGK